MSVGKQTDKVTVDANLSQLALEMRNLMEKVDRLSTQVNGQGAGLAYLTSLGYDNTTGNPANPGSQTDAAWALQALAYMNTVKGVYMGLVRQGGDGSANSAVTFDFNNALSILWAGQLG